MWYNRYVWRKKSHFLHRKRRTKMNCKKIITLATSCLLGVSMLTACTGQSKKVTFNDYWKIDSITKQDVTEELEYTVTYEKQNGLANYELNYLNGKYTTKLTTEEYEGKTVYVYETKLEIDVTYQLGGEITQPLHDVVTSKVRFQQSSGALRPIDSHKEVISHSPVNSTNVTTLDGCYTLNEYTSDIDYVNMKSVLQFKGDAEETINQKVTLNKDYTVLDNEQLLFAIRGLSQTDVSTPTFSVYSPYVNSAQKVKVSFGSETGEDFNLIQNGIAGKHTVQYYPVSIVLNEKNSGQTQTAWVAKTTDASNNKYRNVVLRHSTPLSYGLGSLVYQLISTNYSA